MNRSLEAPGQALRRLNPKYNRWSKAEVAYSERSNEIMRATIVKVLSFSRYCFQGE
jgi:hypothetical protein